MTVNPIVVDSGVAVKWFVAETHSAQANSIYQDYEDGNLELLAPDLIYAEFGNIIWKKQIFQNFDSTDAQTAVNKFQKVIFNLTPAADLFDDALRIAVAHKRTFYDSLYLALAERENCEFVTADERLFNAVGASFPNVVWLPNWK